MSESSVGIGIVGTGTIAQSHLRSLQGFEKARVLGVFDVLADRAEATAQAFAIPTVAPTLDALLEIPGLDAVIVCTPPFAHAEPTITALQAGKHVLCEKPFASTPSEAEEMVLAAEKAGKFLACCSARNRYAFNQTTARALLDRGELGDVYHVRYSQWRFRGRPGHHIFAQSTWFLDHHRAGGGAMTDIAVYMIDSTLGLLGNPKVLSVTAAMRQFTEEPPPAGVKQDVEDHIVLMVQCEGGKSGIVETAWVSNMRNADGLYIFGTKAGLRLDPLTKITPQQLSAEEIPPLSHLGKEVYRAIEEQVLPFSGPGIGHGDVTRPFVEGILAGRAPYTPGRQALEVTRVMDAAYRSVTEQRSISLQ
ncbi:MAG TPA: Gfo/Idh/MocA family oxidoreductase [Chloroflexota bacterium]|nr:Gfo/Idh/MocA family oxidoreductase [Chloroflexota bacterium]